MATGKQDDREAELETSLEALKEYDGPWLGKIKAAMRTMKDMASVSGAGDGLGPGPVKGDGGGASENLDRRRLIDPDIMRGLLDGLRVGFIIAVILWALGAAIFVAWWKL